MIFQGTATALITPFNENGVDLVAYEKVLDDQVKNGVNAVVVLGTTGEPATMTREEKESVIKLAVKKLKGIIPIIVGAGCNSTQNAIELSKFAEDLGADALLHVTPYYNKATQGGLIQHFTAIANSTKLPIILYNVPGRTGVNLLPQTFSKLCEIENIVAIKEASGNMEQIEECIRLCGDKADVYSGDDGLTVPVMAMGGKGVISVVSNAFPKYVSDMTSLAINGDFKKASAMQLKMLPLVKAMFSEVNPIPVKKAMELKGFCSNIIRLPLTEMTEENTKKLVEIMKEF